MSYLKHWSPELVTPPNQVRFKDVRCWSPP